MQSQTIVAVITQLLVVILPMFGVRVGSDSLTSALQTIAVIVTGLWIWVRRYQEGDITVLGRKT